MSSSNTNTSLASSNFLHASTLYWVIHTTCPEYTSGNTSELNDWDNNNNYALGHIILKMDTNLSNCYQDKETTAVVWSGLETQFSNVSVASIFMKFKAMMDTTIPENQHPAPAFFKMTVHFVHFVHLKELSTRYMDTVAQLLNFSSPISAPATTEETAKFISLSDIEKAATVAWQQQNSRRKPTEQHANKISTVKRKGKDPQFSQQQQQQQQHGGSSEQKKGKGRQGKCSSAGEAKQKEHQHTHLNLANSTVSFAFMAVAFPSPLSTPSIVSIPVIDRLIQKAQPPIVPWPSLISRGPSTSLIPLGLPP
ncbi:hypothetical protein BS17DRAFT_766865 [Gyrodon lividus]|nr:hypothetical protein BS17DRAFT_766865 [Gyrodon lividus]